MFSHPVYLFLRKFSLQDSRGGSNLLAGLIIGTALAYFLRQPHLDPFWKLMITTGLCGGLSTFSTFSVEVFALLQAGNYIWALTSVLVHVIGSLIMTALGFFIITILFA
ncbi:fluoride efflux transporter CrcB [Escherichia coli]|uniref:fluoride efflux transporter CrcB n=1 Tax=Escherichia coli TaxID=562 RepID=UPI00311AD16B